MKKPHLLFIVFSVLSKFLFAQPTNDAGMWNTFNVEKKLGDKYSIFITEEYRVRENFSQTNLFYTEIGGEVKLSKFLKLSLSYRNIQKYLNDRTFSFRHRLTLNILLKEKFGNFTISYRQRLQSEVRNYYSSDIGKIPEWYSRNKFEIKYDLDRDITPYIAAEFRYQINNPRATESNKLWHRNRYIAGFNYKLNNQNSFGAFYLIQNEFNVSIRQNLYIVGLEYTLSL